MLKYADKDNDREVAMLVKKYKGKFHVLWDQYF